MAKHSNLNIRWKKETNTNVATIAMIKRANMYVAAVSLRLSGGLSTQTIMHKTNTTLRVTKIYMGKQHHFHIEMQPSKPIHEELKYKLRERLQELFPGKNIEFIDTAMSTPLSYEKEINADSTQEDIDECISRLVAIRRLKDLQTKLQGIIETEIKKKEERELMNYKPIFACCLDDIRMKSVELKPSYNGGYYPNGESRTAKFHGANTANLLVERRYSLYNALQLYESKYWGTTNRSLSMFPEHASHQTCTKVINGYIVITKPSW